METLNTLKLTKYVGVIFFIFILLKLIPRTKLENRDVLISSLVLFALYLIAENVFISNAGCKVDKLDGTIGGINLSQLSTSISQNKAPEAPEAPEAPQAPQAPQAPRVIQNQVNLQNKLRKKINSLIFMYFYFFIRLSV